MYLLLLNLMIVHTMKDFGVIFKRLSLMCDNTNDISIAKNPVFYKKNETSQKETPLPERPY
jgi:hypothetical protein